MTISPYDLLENSFCISINEERERQFKITFKKYFGVVPRIFHGYMDKNLSGPYKCELGHVSIVKMAKAMNMSYVGIFEDDAWPRKDAMHCLEEALCEIPDDAKMLVLGRFMYFGKEKCSSRLTMMSGNHYGSHAYVVFRKGYDEYIQEYDKKPSRNADDFAGTVIRPSYMSVKNIFIQRCDRKSMNGHSGYIFDGGSHDSPPDGFDAAEETLGFQIDEKKLLGISERLSFGPGDRCLVIGSNPSIKGSGLGEHVDGFQGDVVRVNSLPDADMAVDYGVRTDILFTCEWYQKCIKNADFPRKVVVNDEIIRDVSSGYRMAADKWLTTGMVCILMALSRYKEVQILGFGDCRSVESGMYGSVHDSVKIDMSSKDFRHDLNYEHHILDVMSRVNFIGKLCICERNLISLS